MPEQLLYAENVIELFVYGTLRTGQPLESWLEPCTVEKTMAMCIRGRIYPSYNGHYPVAFLDEDGLIHGEVRKCSLSEPFYATVKMEMRAGYKLQRVPLLSKAGLSEGRSVMAFHYMGRHPTKNCIPSGDWEQYEMMKFGMGSF